MCAIGLAKLLFFFYILCMCVQYGWRARRGNLSAVPAVLGTTGRQTERETETDIVRVIYLCGYTVYGFQRL